MNIQRKEQNPQQKTPVAVSSYNRSAYEYVLDQVLPYGKFKGRTLQYIKDHEQWYYRYMQENDLISKWNLERIKDIEIVTTKPKWDPLRVSVDTVWMGVRFLKAE